MPDLTPPLPSHLVLNDPRPWAFTTAELTAGLRRYTGDPTLVITDLKEQEITQRRASMGRIRALDVKIQGATGQNIFFLIHKEPQSTTRAGTAGQGLREASFYRQLKDHIPVRVPVLFAAHPQGNWLVLERLDPGRLSEKWGRKEYLLAIDQLMALHDRFWGLGQDLKAYNWLARPLDSDSDILIQAAKSAVEHMTKKGANSLSQDTELISITKKIIKSTGKILKKLRNTFATLLHGDYWPGNIHMHKNGTLTVYDWEQAAIGPGILDLVNFVQNSTWWFAPLPITVSEITDHYRSRLMQAGSYSYEEEEWDMLWDHALLWIFIAEWVDLLSHMPDSMLNTRLPAINAVLLEPIKLAAKRRL